MTEAEKIIRAEIRKQIDEGEKWLIMQIQKEHDIANKLVSILRSYNLSAQEEFNVVQNFKTALLGDVPLYS